MFHYFPGNYVWNLSINLALEMGAHIGEIEEICRPLLDISRLGADEGTTAFLHAFVAMGDKQVELAAEDEALGRWLSAAAKHSRASTYYLTAERMQPAGSAPRKALYAKVLDSFAKSLAMGRENALRVDIPYLGGIIPGYFVAAANPDGEGPAPERAPVVVMVNGLDSTKEMVYRVGLPAALSKRGVSTLVIDQPGTGEALRLHDLHAVVESETWASVVVDWLEGQSFVDPRKIGMHGVSLGGYYAPRAVAFEPRFALGAVWGANYNWGEVQKRRLAREGERPVPHYWDHVCWVFGMPDMDSFMALAERMTLDGVLDNIRVPFLVTHGEKDRQIPLEYAHRTFEQLINSPKKELKIFTDREGGVQHSSVDNSANARDFQADWIAETFASL